jgi:3-hydroxyacyl-CoA dehydrogenase
MGAQVAAHLAGCGLEVALLDLPEGEGEDRSGPARRGLEALRPLKPSPLHLPEDAGLIVPGNFEDDLSQVRGADWVFEAVVEDLAVKKALFESLAPLLTPGAWLTTNTSGLGIGAMSAGLPGGVRARFFGTHFFNPPRYLKLLEVIPGPDIEAPHLDGFTAFAEAGLGKGVVRAKDTPGFIANRIGSFGFGVAVRAMMDLGLGVDEVDELTGPLIGRARSATFRTADLAGVDICARVASHLHQALPHDPEREAFRMPAFMQAMLEARRLGEKAGAGFYKKDGKRILVLDWPTGDYRERSVRPLGSVAAAKAVADLAARLRGLLAATDAGGAFLWRVLSATCLYAAALVPEIADDPVAVDRAMEWGYGWGLGPFRLLDALGVKEVAERAAAEGRVIPPLLASLLSSGRTVFHAQEAGRASVFAPGGPRAVPDRPGEISLAAVRSAGRVVRKNPGASLLDLGDGCGLVEFHSKMNTLGPDAFALLHGAAREGRRNFDALVVGNQGGQFTVGANLMLVLLAAQEEEWDELGGSIRRFQDANMALKCADLPVVAAPFGLTLGGGCEIALHSTRVRASAETYMGLVEAGVGLVPAGGGTKEMALRALDRVAGVPGAEAFPFVQRAFDRIAFGRVSTSGAEARQWFLTPADSLSAHPDRLIAEAKEVALGLHRAGHRPARPRDDVPVLGRPALATFRMGIHNALRGKQISEHDALVAGKVAHILCGGDRAPGLASEQHFLDLEREAFLSLLGTGRTRERIQHMLKEGKPLRN